MPARRSACLVAALLFALVLGARASTAQPAPAAVAYSYAATLGSTDLPWQRSDTNLNQPWGVGADGDGAWVANAGGRNLVRFGTGAVQGLGRAGHLGDLWGRPTRWLADVTAVGDPSIVVQPAHVAAAGVKSARQPKSGPAQVEERAIWFVDRDAHVAVGLPVWPDGDLGTPLVLGQPDVPGGEPGRFRAPTGIALAPSGAVYVSDTGNHRIEIYDGKSGDRTGTIGRSGRSGATNDLFSSPGRLVVSADEVLFVADTGNHRVQAFDVRGGAAPKYLRSYGQVGAPGAGNDQLNAPLGVGVDGSLVYVADSGNARVQVLQRSDGRHVRTLNGASATACGTGAPNGRWDFVSDVAATSDGTLYVALPRRMQVVTCDAITQGEQRTYGVRDVPYQPGDSLYNAPAGVAVTADGRVTIVELEGQRVLRRTAEGGVVWQFGAAGIVGSDDTHLSGPSDIVQLADGRSVIADTGNGRLVVLDVLGRRAAIWGKGTLTAPTGLGLLPNGRVAVADPGAGKLFLFDGTGASVAPPPITGLVAPSDVAVDGQGRWYVTDRKPGQLLRFDAGGAPAGSVGEADPPDDGFAYFLQPQAVAVAPDGRVFVADTANNRVQVFDSDLKYLTTLGGADGPGSGGLREPRGLAIAPDGRLYVADTYHHRVQVFEPAAGDWLPAITNGFGTRTTDAVMALAEWGGRLYAGSEDNELGAGLWRWDGTGAWQPAALGAVAGAGQTAVASFVSHGNMLYAGTESRMLTIGPISGIQRATTDGGEVWRTGDGTSWQKVAAAGFGVTDNAAVSAMASYEGQLYAGTRSLDPATVGGVEPQLWRSASGDDGSWQQVALGGGNALEWAKNGAVTAMTAYSNTLYLGTCADDGAQLWASSDGNAWWPAGYQDDPDDPATRVPQVGGGGAACFSSFAEYGGYLYAGLGNEAAEPGRYAIVDGAAEVWRCKKCDGTDWDPAVADGLGNEQNSGRVALAAFDEPPFRYLYLTVGNSTSGLEIWRTPDGVDWEPFMQGGFGDDNNAHGGTGSSLGAFRGRLYAGTQNGAHGGELWSTAGGRPVVPTPTSTVPGTTPVATAVPSATPTTRPSPQPPTGRARYHKVAEWPILPAAAGDVLGAPVDMALGADGTAYIADQAPGRLLRLLPGGTWAPAVGGSGTGPERLTQPAAVAVDDNADRVYVSDIGNDRVVVYTRAGVYVTFFSGLNAIDLEVRPDGTLWVADRLAGAARRLAADGTELERFGTYGPTEDNEFQGLVAVTEDVGDTLWIADLGGTRIRAYVRSGASFQRLRTIDLTTGAWVGRPCSGQRLQSLAAEVVLAGACILDDGQLRDTMPADHRGSDLYNVGLRTVHVGSGLYFALAGYDLDLWDPFNASYPSVVQYLDEGFDIVTGTWRGLWFTMDTADPNAVQDPVRLSALPDGSLILSDNLGLRRFEPDGRVREVLPIESVPSRGAEYTIDPRLVVGTGEVGGVMGIARYFYTTARPRPGHAASLDLQVAFYGKGLTRRVCQNRVCRSRVYLDPVWDTTLRNNNLERGANDYNYAATYEYLSKQFVLLQLHAENPSDLELPARVLFFAKDGMGRKTEVALVGGDRDALWSDIDAGPDGRIYVLDTLGDKVQVLAADGRDLGRIDTPKDSWKVAGGPNGEVFVLTTYGQVVRLASDGKVLGRFVGLPNDYTPHTALADLAVDAWGRVYTIDDIFDQVTVFEPEGTEDDVLQGAKCNMAGDKWVDPQDILLGDTAQLFLTLFGSCGFKEEASDVILAVASDSGAWTTNANLRVARQLLSLVDLDVHRVAVISFGSDAAVEQALTNDRTSLIRAVKSMPNRRPLVCGIIPYSNHVMALREAEKLLSDMPERRKVVVLIPPGLEMPPGSNCPWTDRDASTVSARLKARGATIVAVNAPSIAASSELLSNIPVAERGQGVGRAALRRSILRLWPDFLVKVGTLTDKLPANIDYVPNSANPPASWDAASRTLTWNLADLPLGKLQQFSLRIKPLAEGKWPTNILAQADGTDGWGNPIRAVLPIPEIRVYGEFPTQTPTPTLLPTQTPTPTITPTPRPTTPPEPIFLPITLRTELCKPGSKNADVAVVIDTSGSMSETTSPGGPTKLAAARDAARSFLKQLVLGQDQAALVQFNTTATTVVPLTGNIAAVDAGLDQLTQAVGTRIDLALEEATAQLTGASHKPGNNQVVVLLTDGEPTGATPDEVRAAAKKAKDAGLLVFTIGLGQAVDQALMRDIASKPEWYFFAPDTSQLEAIYGQIAYSIPCKPMWPVWP